MIDHFVEGLLCLLRLSIDSGLLRVWSILNICLYIIFHFMDKVTEKLTGLLSKNFGVKTDVYFVP